MNMTVETTPAAYEKRLWAKVNKDGPIPGYRPELGPCWLWTGSTNSHGYGLIKVNGRSLLAHRATYELMHGPIQPSVEPDHLCRVRSCVRPDHLELLTHRENVLRGMGPTAQHARQTHCLRGHPFSETNTYLWRTSRHCRACKRKRGAAQNRCRKVGNL